MSVQPSHNSLYIISCMDVIAVNPKPLPAAYRNLLGVDLIAKELPAS